MENLSNARTELNSAVRKRVQSQRWPKCCLSERHHVQAPFFHVLYLSLASISPHMTDSGTMRTEASLLSVWAPASSSTMTDFTLDHSLTVRRAKHKAEQIIVNKVNLHHHNLEPKLTIDDDIRTSRCVISSLSLIYLTQWLHAKDVNMGADILSLDENLVFIVRPTAGTQGRLRSDDMWGAAMNSTLRQLTEDMAKMKEDMLKVSKLEKDNTQMTLKISQMTSEISKLREDLAQETAGRLCDMADLNEKIDAEKLRCATKHGNLVQELAAAEEERTAADERLTAAEEKLTATKEELQLNIDSVAKSNPP